MLYTAPLHKKRKWIASHLADDLMLRYKRRSIPIVRGDTAKVMRGEFKGKRGVMAASWVTPVSRDPAIVAVSISPKRETFKLIVNSGYFALNVLDLDFIENVNKAGTISAREVKDKFLEVNLTPIPGKFIKAPVIKEAKAFSTR